MLRQKIYEFLVLKTNLENIKGTGKNGVVLKEDIMNLMGQKPLPSEKRITHGPEERIKMTRLRLTIAKRLKEAQENAAMLTTFNEIDMHEVILMKNNYKEEFQKKYSVKLGFMSFFVKACVIGLKNFPSINAEIQNESENSDFNFVEQLNEEDFERIDYGVAVGLAFEFETIRLGARYNYGLAEIGKSHGFTLNGSEQQSDQFKNLRNSTFSLYLGLGF